MALTKTQKKGLLRGAVVTAITLALITGVGYIFTYRKSESYFNVKGLYTLENLDVLFVGNSHAIVGIDADQFDDLTGTKSYNVATTSQTVLSAKLLVKEALAAHEDIDLIVIETFSMIYPTPFDEGYSRALDADTAVLRSVNDYYTKLYGMVNQPGLRRKFDAFLPLIKYHANWKTPDLWHTRFLFDKSRTEIYNRYLTLHDQGSRSSPYILTKEKLASYDDYYYDFSVSSAMDTNLKYWDSIIEMCREENVDVVFITLPWLPVFVDHTNYDEIYTAFSDYFDAKGVTYIDLNRTGLSLEYTDFADENVGPNQHLNNIGADKVTDWIAKWYLRQHDQGE